MGKYCDPKELESTWWAWIIAQRTPKLDLPRNEGLLWTRGLNSELEHCIASSNPCWLVSKDGIISDSDLDSSMRSSFSPLDLALARRLSADNFLYEQPGDESWTKLSALVYKICSGVALNFRPPTEDVKNELVQEAFAQTLSKIQRGKLQFDPGRAPAFNLLTTAIFRIMYSIKNKEKRERDHKSRLVNDLVSGTRLPNLKTIRVSQSLIGNDNKIKT